MRAESATPSADEVAPASTAPEIAAEDPPAAPPNQCEGLRVSIGEDDRRKIKRIRKQWSTEDRKRFRSLVRLVAKEMGAEPRLFQAWALRESTYRPSAIHILNSDIVAASSALRRYTYDPRAEAELEAVMKESGPQDERYWKARGRLQRVRRFKENPHRDALVSYKLTMKDGKVQQSSRSAWTFGYGPFGFNPAYFVPVWDHRAPPWVFCQDDGIPAIVTAIWAARSNRRECERAGLPGSYAVVNRRFATGHCTLPPEDGSFTRRLARVGLSGNARARLGTRWKRAETDRAELLATLRAKAAAAGLLSHAALDTM